MALEQGLTRAIGVSNYNATHLERLRAARTTTVVPAVNQCEMNVAKHDDATIQCAAGGLRSLDMRNNFETFPGRYCLRSITSRFASGVNFTCSFW